MKNSLAKTKEILNSVSGFHQYVLTEPFRLDFASSSLCAMLGAAKDELLSDSADLYRSRAGSEQSGQSQAGKAGSPSV